MEDELNLIVQRMAVALRNLFGFLVLCSVAATLLLRHHFRDLTELAQTYRSFYPLLQQHPDILIRYQPSLLSETELPGLKEKEQVVPKILHQVFLTEGQNTSMAKYQAGIDSCKALHHGWTYLMWTDRKANLFISEHYPTLYEHYKNYGQSIQRANILRYALLEHFGGAYLDIDITCERPLDDLRQIPFLTPGAYPAGVNNAFILSRPQHPFLRHLLAGVPSRDLTWGMPYVENMLSTGCGYFGNRWMSYAKNLMLYDNGHGIWAQDAVHILADSEGDMGPHMLRGKVTTPLFKHGGASSWHSWDAAVIVLVGKHYLCFGSILLLLFGGMALASWRMFRPQNRAMRRFSSSLLEKLEKLKDEEAALPVKVG